MDFEAMRKIPRRQQTPRRLEQVCSEIADRLTSKEWHSANSINTSFSRSYTMYETIDSDDDDDERSIIGRVELKFMADKIYLEGDDGYVVPQPTYTLTSTAAQVIDKSEIPAQVTQEILSEAKEDGDDDDVFSAIMDESDFDNFEIEREQGVKYEIGPDGVVMSYDLTFRYTFDGDEMFLQEYDTDFEKMFMIPICLKNDNVAIDYKPAVLTVLNEFSIESHVREIDERWREFLQSRELQNDLEFAAQSQQEHIKRALGIIMLLRSGLF